jgi:hypothetical protein
LPDPAGAICVEGACGCAQDSDCDLGVSCVVGRCEEPGMEVGAGWWDDIGERIDVYTPGLLNYGQQHWFDIRVFNAETGDYIDFMSVYHVDAGFGIYFDGNTTWEASWYRFHGSKSEFRARGLPRYVKFRFIDDQEVAYSAYSNIVDLGL